MSFQQTQWTILKDNTEDGMLLIGIHNPTKWPADIPVGKQVYLTTEPPKPQARTDDMQHVVEAEQSASAPGQGWRKKTDEHAGITYIMDGSRRVCMVNASWCISAKTEAEREATLRELREAYFRNVPLLVNAQRMFDLLRRLRDNRCVFNNDLEDELEHMIKTIKTQQWEPETPKG